MSAEKENQEFMENGIQLYLVCYLINSLCLYLQKSQKIIPLIHPQWMASNTIKYNSQMFQYVKVKWKSM